jgi:hypothetical protein
VLSSLIPLIQANTNDPWASVYSNWLYRREITITNNNAYDLTDFQVKVTLDSTNFDSWNKVNADGSDIRFADAQGNPLNYYIESWDATNQQAIIWVKVPSILAGGSTTIYLYYGNSQATDASDGNAVFEFFDDFNTFDNTKWEWYNLDAAPTVSNSWVDIDYDSSTGWNYFRSVWTFPNTDGYIIKAKVKHVSNYPNAGSIFVGAAPDSYQTYNIGANKKVVSADFNVRVDNTIYNTISTFQPANGDIFTIETTLKSSEVIGKVTYGGQTWTTSYATTVNVQGWRITFFQFGEHYQMDYVFVRKYTDQEPSTTIGAEEVNNPVTVTFDFKDDLGNTLNGVDVYIDNTFYGTFNSGDSVIIPAGTHTFLAQKQYYVDAQQTLDVQSDTTLTLTLDRQSYTVYFYAYDVNNQLINNFTVYANNSLLGTFNSGDSALVKYGTYVFRFEKELYKSVTLQKLINANGIIVNFTNIMLDNVKLITLYFYDASNNTMLNNVSVTVNNETNYLNSGESLQLVEGNYTLTFSKENYENRTLNIELTSDLTISVYLEPQGNETTSTIPEIKPTIPENLSQAIVPINEYAKAFLDSGGSFGDTVVNAIKADSMIKLILPQGFIFVITIVVLWQTQNPLSGIGAALIMQAMWLGILREKPNLTNSGVTFVLFVFLVAWTLWDLFYNYSRET